MSDIIRPRIIFLLIVLSALSFAHPAWAKKPVNTNWLGLAVKGYDVVAYFTLGTPTKGDKAFSYEWRDATWRFANAAHLELFTSNPERYAPQYGGY